MKVRAKEAAFFRGVRVRPGAVIEVVGKCPKWAQPVDDKARSDPPKAEKAQPVALKDSSLAVKDADPPKAEKKK
jgi:hypothetical protein